MLEITHQRITRILPVELSEDDKAGLVRKVTKARDRILDLEAEKKEFNTQNKKMTESAEANMDEALNTLRRGREDRTVDCQERWNYTSGQIIVTRMDTGEVVEDRTMSALERQQPLALEPMEPEVTLAERNQAIIDEEWAAWEAEEDEREKSEEMAKAEDSGAIPINRGQAA